MESHEFRAKCPLHSAPVLCFILDIYHLLYIIHVTIAGSRPSGFRDGDGGAMSDPCHVHRLIRFREDNILGRFFLIFIYLETFLVVFKRLVQKSAKS